MWMQNLHHDLMTGKAVTAVLHFANATPFQWYSKRQSTVETATFGSQFVAPRTTVDQVMDTTNTLMYLGVPVRPTSDMFGNNKSIVDNASVPIFSFV